MTKKYFLLEVEKEIEHIKENATKEELNNLSYSQFDHDSTISCLYGLLTGYCDSDRARKLNKKSFAFGFNEDNFKEALKSEEGNTFTHLEIYLFYCDDDTHKNIIDYLKGDVETLNKLKTK